MWLVIVALFGLIVPNGLFLYWFLAEYRGVGAVLEDRLALSFILDAFLVLGILCVYFARRPIGRIPWYWFCVLSIIGGLGFGLPFYYWLNVRRTRGPAGPARG